MRPDTGSLMSTAFTSPAGTGTVTVCHYPIIAALVAAEGILGKDRVWNAINTRQQQFLAESFAAGRGQIGKIPEIESITSWDYQVINQFLSSRGFDIQLDAFAPNEFGAASVLKLAMQWLEAGEAGVLMGPGRRTYDAVIMKGDGFALRSSPNLAHPVVVLKTKTSDLVLLTKVDKPVSELELPQVARNMFTAGPSADYAEEVAFPMVDLDMQPDISWLLQMHTVDSAGMPWKISQALQQTKFAMDEFGAIVESAAALGMRCLCIPNRYEINGPFVAAVYRPSLKLPVFIGYLDTDCWSRPNRTV